MSRGASYSVETIGCSRRRSFASYQVRLAQTVISRHILQPGWSWEEHAQPSVGTSSCELYHRGVVLRGREARAMATILFTDIVDSTVLVREAGDASWKRTVAMHEDVVRSVPAGFPAPEIQPAGDSFLVVFDSVEGAIRCGLALVGPLNAIQLQIRVGIPRDRRGGGG